VTRVLSGAVLLIIAVAVVWFAPPLLFLIVAEVLVGLACHEYVGLARARGLTVPFVLSTLAAVVVCASFTRMPMGGWSTVPIDIVLLSSLLSIGTIALFTWRGGSDAIASVSAALLPALYLGLPLGSMVAIRETWGREALFLVMLTIVISDSAQYYSGRAFGKRPLAPAVSPKKTIEGAVGGFVFGAVALAGIGIWWLPTVPLAVRALLGMAVVALGIVGDLFESMLKRSAGVKDSSALIPGHGGILDRIDALLFAAPIYYIVLKYV
jgi:phosphatidate cytidylyltransferase